MKSPADAWLATLTGTDTASFKAMRTAFELWWLPKPITEKTMVEKQALHDETILKQSDLGKRMAAGIWAEEELSHVVWVDKVERLAGDIPDTNNLLIMATHKKTPKSTSKVGGPEAHDMETVRRCSKGGNTGGINGENRRRTRHVLHQ